ncbi:MAG TPA: tetratricopeptide repeat protein [Paucimonas sp.]|nr:tetratricopeptide repeat protein [Paucimonas sp.]
MNNMSRKSSTPSNAGWRRAWSSSFAVTSLLAALSAAPAFADEAADVSKLLRGGQLAEAMSKADAFLAQHPRDAQMRFLKGVILTEQNKQNEAIAIFTKLTEDFPDLPEPYNNLAVLYAASGQYDKARGALENAIRTNPSYATAYENLGDVHAKLASQAYDKALQLDSGNSAAKSKLTMLRSLTVAGSKGGAPAAAAKTPAPVVVAQAPKTAAPAPAVPAAATAPAAQKPAVAPAPAPATLPPVAAAKPEPAKAASEPKPAAKPAKPANDGEAERTEVLNVVHAWAKSWSARDVKGYLNHYANDFQTPNGESRKAWAAERESRIAGKGRISVKIEAPSVSIEGNTATVKFRQNYVSDRLTAASRKTLVLAKQGGRWQIKQERTGN